MNKSLVLQIFLNLIFYGSDIACHVRMRNHYAFGFGGRPRRKDNLQNIGGLNWKRTEALAGMLRDQLLEACWIDSVDLACDWLCVFCPVLGSLLRKNVSSVRCTKHQPRRHLFTDAPREIWMGLIVDRNRDHSA